MYIHIHMYIQKNTHPHKTSMFKDEDPLRGCCSTRIPATRTHYTI